MTNEEALRILHCPDTVGGLYSEKYGEALSMAMEALKKDPFEDCVSREEVHNLIIPWLNDYLLDETREALETIDYKIEDLPSVTSQPKTGHWIDRFPTKECKCSVCDFLICISNESYIDMIGQMKYCPNCGAKMIELQEGEDEE